LRAPRFNWSAGCLNHPTSSQNIINIVVIKIQYYLNITILNCNMQINMLFHK
jgi:hypothetical protein